MLTKKNQSRYWDKNLDNKNLRQDFAAHYDSVIRGKLFFHTPEQKILFNALDPQFGKKYLEIGSGLGLNALEMARAGGMVVGLDISAERLKLLSSVANQEGLSHRLFLVKAKGEQLPFKEGVFDGITSRAVLIHTEVNIVMGEIRRSLVPGGVVGIVEPMAYNPLVNIYRKYFAPKEWAEIATYFTQREIEEFRNQFQIPDKSKGVYYFYFVSFLAFGFQYYFSRPLIFHKSLWILERLDRILMRFYPSLKNKCWFVVLVGHKPLKV